MAFQRALEIRLLRELAGVTGMLPASEGCSRVLQDPEREMRGLRELGET